MKIKYLDAYITLYYFYGKNIQIMRSHFSLEERKRELDKKLE